MLRILLFSKRHNERNYTAHFESFYKVARNKLHEIRLLFLVSLQRLLFPNLCCTLL